MIYTIEENNVFLYAIKGMKNVIYNKITNSLGQALYPDILYQHDFAETAICRDELFDIAKDAFKKYGVSACIFAALTDEGTAKLLYERLSAVLSQNKVLVFTDEEQLLIDKLCEDLSLSQTMTSAFKQHVIFYCIDNEAPVSKLLISIREQYELPTATKNEGKKIYENICGQITKQNL